MICSDQKIIWAWQYRKIFPKEYIQRVAHWIAWNAILVWLVDMVYQILIISVYIRENLTIILNSILLKANIVSKQTCFHLIVILWWEVPAVAEVTGISGHMQNALQVSKLKRVFLSVNVHDYINLWWYLLSSLTKLPNHLWEIQPHPLTCSGAIDASLEGMWVLCYSPHIYWLIWCLPARYFTKLFYVR